jgi:type I restriction enzyme S subunit
MIVGDLVDSGFAEIKTGPFGTQLKASDYVETGRPVLNVRNVGFGDVRPEKFEYIDEATAARLSGHILQRGDLVFGRKGAVERHAFIDEAYAGSLQGSDCIRLRILPDSPVRASFLTFALRTREHQQWMQSYCSHGATMASLNQNILRQIPLPDLDLATQDAVAQILQGIDDLIDNNQRRVEVLEEMARAIYREWFVDFRFPGHENANFLESKIGRLPSDWSITTLGDSARWLSGGTPSTTNGEYWGGRIPWITSGSLTSLLLDRSERTLTEAGAANGTRMVDRDALLFVVRGMSLVKEFRVGIADTRLAFGQDVKALVAVDGIDPIFLAFSVITRADEIQRMVELAGHGTGKLSSDRLKAIRIARPPIDVQARFAREVQSLRDLMTTLRLVTDRLIRMRDGLLPKLVSGHIDVSSLDLNGLIEDSVA